MADRKDTDRDLLAKHLVTMDEVNESIRKAKTPSFVKHLDALKNRRGERANVDVLDWSGFVDGDKNVQSVSPEELQRLRDANPFARVPTEEIAQVLAATRLKLAQIDPTSEAAAALLAEANAKGVPFDSLTTLVDEATRNRVIVSPRSEVPSPPARRSKRLLLVSLSVGVLALALALLWWGLDRW